MTSFPDLDLASASRFVATLGLVFHHVTGRWVRGDIMLGPEHHSAWGLVHGGVFSTVVERAASVGASSAVADNGQFAVGLHNATDVIAHTTGGLVEVTAEPVFQGDLHQIWTVALIGVDATYLARGEVRLRNVDRRLMSACSGTSTT